MTENQRIKIDNLIDILPDCDKAIYHDIAKYAAELGYSPAKVNDKYKPVVFAKMIKGYGHRGICRISPPNPTSREVKTKFAMSFYAASEYQDIFHEAVRIACESRNNTWEASDYSTVYSHEHENNNCDKRKESCDKCRKCKNYYYSYPNGKIVGCDHINLIELPPINEEHVDEIKRLMKIQHECWTHHL